MVWLIILVLLLICWGSAINYFGIELMICAFEWAGGSAILGFNLGLLATALGTFVILMSAQLIYMIIHER